MEGDGRCWSSSIKARLLSGVFHLCPDMDSSMLRTIRLVPVGSFSKSLVQADVRALFVQLQIVPVEHILTVLIRSGMCMWSQIKPLPIDLFRTLCFLLCVSHWYCCLFSFCFCRFFRWDNSSSYSLSFPDLLVSNSCPLSLCRVLFC